MADNDQIVPFVRLTDLSTGEVVAATSRVLVGSEIVQPTNEPGTLSVSLSVAEQGDGPEAVADVLLSAVGGPDGQQPLRPILLEFSLDGGALVDAAMQVRQLTQDAGKLQVTVSGPQVGILYGTRYLEKTPYPLVLLADALGAPAGTIPVIRTAANGTPIYGVLGRSGTYPFLGGIFQRVAGSATWAAHALLKVTPVLDSSVAWQTITERSYADTLLKALDLICQKLTSDVDSAVGHFVLESCSAALSLSARMAGIVTGGTTRPSPQNPGKTSQQLGGVRNALVVGHVGQTPYVIFDGTGTGAIADETAETAPLLTGRLTSTPDTSATLLEMNKTGGSTRAGLPPGGTITRVTCLHRSRVDHDGKMIWPHAAWWQANLPIVGVYASTNVGGIYYVPGDGRLHAFGPQAGINDIAVDDLKGMIYAATDAGVFRHSADVTATGEPWVRVGDNIGKVRRLQVVVLDVSPYYPKPPNIDLESYVWAHVKGSGKEHDGIYRHDTLRGALDLTNYLTFDQVTDTSSGIGNDRWSRMVPSDAVKDFVATDHHSCYYLDTIDQTKLRYFNFWPVPGGLNKPPQKTQTTDFPLLQGATGTRLDRAVTVGLKGAQPPSGLTATDGGTGAGAQMPVNFTLYYTVTSFDKNGTETGPAAPVAFVQGDSPHKVILSWIPPKGSTDLAVYRGVNSPSPGLAKFLIKLGSGTATGWTDDGSIAPSITLAAPSVSKTDLPPSDSVWITTQHDDWGLQFIRVSGSPDPGDTTEGVDAPPTSNFDPLTGLLIGSNSPGGVSTQPVLTLAPGNKDGSLTTGVDGQPLIINSVVGPGLVVDGTRLAVVACTSAGLYYASKINGKDWQPIGEYGIAGYSILDFAGGQTQQRAATDGIQCFYATTDSDLLISTSRGDWWEPLGDGSKVELTAYFADLARQLLGTYPDNDLVSIGPAPDVVKRGRIVHKSTSGSKTPIVPSLPSTFAWQRRLEDEQGWVTWLADTASGSTNQSMEQVTEVQADALISDTQAAQVLAALTVRHLQETNDPITSLTLGSAFRTQGARLRRLKPTDQVAALYTGELRAFDAEGNVVSSTYLDLSKLRLYGLKHTLRLKNGGVVETETEASTSLRTRRLSTSDWAASMMQRIKAVALQRV